MILSLLIACSHVLRHKFSQFNAEILGFMFNNRLSSCLVADNFKSLLLLQPKVQKAIAYNLHPL